MIRKLPLLVGTFSYNDLKITPFSGYFNCNDLKKHLITTLMVLSNY
jgi:hypothetical protein